MEIIDWLNANNGAVIGIATVVLVGITGYAPEGIIAVDPATA